MNFRHFPELSWKWSYLGFWIICLLISGLMLRYFRRKHWL
jgi:Mg2+ and Co2+ transporter CorA